MDTFLVVGLGNPDGRYAHTRHNAGFDVIDILAQMTQIRMIKRRARAIVGEGTLDGKRLVLAQPQTFMNLSGESVAPLVQWYKPPRDGLVLVYDDVDLPQGMIRVRPSGSAGTHNGMRSVISMLGREDFPRIRVGIGMPPPGWDMADWVISHYESAKARDLAFESYQAAANAVLIYLREGMEPCMRTYNQKMAKEGV